jgi:hypothetical protein
MKEEHHPIWVKLRAELIKHFHDKFNPGKFRYGFDMLYAIKIAESELKNSLVDSEFIITIDELLLYTLDECLEIITERQSAFIKKIISG